MSQKPIIDNSLTKVRSKIDSSCNWTGSADFGRLIPFHIEELVPTDKVITCRPKIEMQLLPLASPTFGKLDLYVHYFFVPTRLLWSSSRDVFSRQGPNKQATPPYFTLYDLASYYQGSSTTAGMRRTLFKHWTSMGLPPFFSHSSYKTYNTANTKDRLTLLKFRAYSQIWWDFYRDPEVLRDDVKNDWLSTRSGHFDGSIAAELASLLPRYRTLKDNWISNLFSSPGTSPAIITDLYEQQNAESPATTDIVSGDETAVKMRKIEALTRLSERLSLAGKRQIDALFAAYGVKPEFDKLSMCEYVGGSKSTVATTDIISSADTYDVEAGTGTPLGQKAGQGYCRLENLNIKYTAKESGYLVGLLSVMPHVHFVQGLDKSWYRNQVYDWFTKSLERTGQVAVAKKEVGLFTSKSPNYVQANDDQTFAFTQPYYEYKMGRDILAGDFMYYHSPQVIVPESDEENINGQYMQSLEMYVDYNADRLFKYENLLIDEYPFNKIFFYLGGGMYTDTDDHFHLCVDKIVKKDSPMDGYAVPTLETTQDPHKASAPVGGDTVL